MAGIAKVAVVTGGASGIGEAIVDDFVRRGYAVAIWDRNDDRARATADRIVARGSRAIAQHLDVSDAAAVDAAAEASAKALGAIDILVNCAGFGSITPLAGQTAQVYDDVIGANLTGQFNCIRPLVEEMAKAGWGRIVNIGSVAGQIGTGYGAAYAAAKAGVIGLTRAIAAEFADRGVTCNCVCPGAIMTPMMRDAAAKGIVDVARLTAITRVGRIGTPEDIAAAVAYFASDEGGFVTGQILSVNGGQFI